MSEDTPTPPAPAALTLSLISHTNVGKTTLARTLLKRDIGQVRDEPHVTEVNEAHTMFTNDAGEILRLWDTPGFGDSARLLKRLKQTSGYNPVGWFLGQVWDRVKNRPLWCSQQAVKNVREDADVVLYLVNAGENPDDAPYVAMEMEILGYIAKPVIVLLNQTRADEGQEHRLAEAWRQHLRAFSHVKAVLNLDAFARCWVQEDRLLTTVVEVLPPAHQAVARRLAVGWRERNERIFVAAMERLAAHLARTATDREALEPSGGLRRLIDTVTRRPDGRAQAATQALAKRLDADVLEMMDALISLHGLDGRATGEILRTLKEHVVATRMVDETAASVMGGLVSGALSGLAADFLAGGLTFGGGAVLGALLGALGAKGLARGYNLVRTGGQEEVRWSPEVLDSLFRLALLRYLAVAHYGRGRGPFTDSPHPPRWIRELGTVMDERDDIRRTLAEATPAQRAAAERRLKEQLQETGRAVLQRLYPSV